MRRTAPFTAGITALALLALLAGPAAGLPLLPTRGDPSPSTSASADYSDPIQLNVAQGWGYEPGIKAAPDGTLYAFAHKGNVAAEGTRLASWLWYSRDQGVTWENMPSPAGVHDLMWGGETELAIDPANRIYQEETYLADSDFTTWQGGPNGPQWELGRPAMPTVQYDDRPWIAAQAPGILHYVADGEALEVPSILDGSLIQTRMFYSLSTDGGLTWSTPRGVPDVGFCHLDADRSDARSVYIACYHSGGTSLSVFESHDVGATWTRVEVAPLRAGPAYLFPSVSVGPDGIVRVAWVDDITGTPQPPGAEGLLFGPTHDPDPARLMVSTRAPDGSWTSEDVAPFAGSIVEPWIQSGANGLVSVVFYETRDLDISDASPWYAYAETWCAGASQHERHAAQLDAQPSGFGENFPADFFENAIGIDGRVHVTYERIHDTDVVADLAQPEIHSNLFTVAQRAPMAC